MTAAAHPDPSRLEEGDARLAQAMEELDRRLAEYLDLWSRRLEGELTGPLRDAAAQARDAHARLMEEARLEERKTEGKQTAAPDWRALRRYREGVRGEVVEPLLEALSLIHPGPRIGSLWDDFLRQVESAASPLPEEVLRSEPGDLYAPAPGQGLYATAVRGTVRAGRTLGRPFTRGKVRSQRVPLRSLARRHFRGEALPGVVDHAEALQQHHARPVAILEAAVGRWVRDWFPLERTGHDPEAHLDPESLQALDRLRERVASVRVTEGPEGSGTAEGEPDTANGADDSGADAQGTVDARAEGEDAGSVPAEGASGGEASAPPPGEDPAAAPATPASVARTLHEALESAAGLPAPDGILQGIQANLEILEDRLRESIRVADSPLARRPPAREDKRFQRLAERLAVRTRRWTGWHDTARDRFRFGHAVLSLRHDLDSAVDRLLDQVLQESILFLEAHLGETRKALRDLRDRARDPASPLQSSRDRETVAEAARKILEEAREILETRMLAPVLEGGAREAVLRTGEQVAETISERLRHLPDSATVHPIKPVGEMVDPTQATRTIPVRETARQALDVLHLESIRTSPTPLLKYLEEAREACRQIPEIVSYNLTAARDELLEEPGEGETPADAGGPPPGEEEPKEEEVSGVSRGEALLEDARTLTLQGLDRTAQGLDAILARSLTPWEGFSTRAHQIVVRALEQIHTRLVTERAVQEQMQDVRSLLEKWYRAAREQVVAGWGSVERQGRRFLRRRYVDVLRLVRRGRHALGAEAPHEGEGERALETLRNIPALLEPLPLVYRRLFSFHPVSDPALLVGREDDLAWISRRYEAWKGGQHTLTLLTGPVTVGHTSFLNVVAAEVFREARVVRLPLAERYRFESTLAERLVSALRDAGEDLPAEGPWTLDRVAGLLRAPPAKQSDAPPLVVLAEAFLAFQARTANRVFWVSTISDPGWKLLAKTEPRAASLAATGSLGTPDRATLEEILMTRHRRSGVPVEFLPPADPNPLLKRRLQKTHREEGRQELLRSEFFDRLHRASQGNIPMAILLWLKAADFGSREGWLRLNPPRSIRFAFMEELDVGLDFALMALLEHGSLTLEEYGDVFAASPDESFQTLEALRTRMLVDRLDTQGGLPTPVVELEPGVRYRIPPILGHVVTGYLRNHNILH